ncbi:MAG: hypothetical protein CL578_18395 [Alteromonadaceae bacterium]|nr:hypothetical protein [Alteromonadaceae bacterium]
MKSAFVNMFIIIALLGVQVGASFALSQMPCNDEMTAEMDHSSHPMMDHSQSDDTNSCCNQDCCCPMAMFHIGLPSRHYNSSQENVSLSIQSHNSNLHQVFIAALQRPPKYSLI